MNILIVNTYYYPEIIGGAEYSVKYLAENLVKLGHSVSVLCTGNEDTNDYLNGVHIYRMKSITTCRANVAYQNNRIKRLGRRVFDLYNPLNIKKILHVMDIVKPDVIHTNGLYDISPVIWQIAKVKKIKVIHTLRDYFLMCPTVNLMPRKSNASTCENCKEICTIYRTINKNFGEWVDIITAPSKFTLSKFTEENYFKNAIQIVVPNAIEYSIEKFNEIKYQRIQEKKFKSKMVFIYSGGLEEHKGLNWLLSSFSNIKNNNIELLIAGKGSLKETVIEYMDKDPRIHYVGFCSQEELSDYLTKSDVLVCPSLWDEPFGRVVIEAYAHCMPVIVSNKGGLPENVMEGQTGIIIDPEDKNSLYTSMVNFIDGLINLETYWDNIGYNLEGYSITHQAEKFVQIYNNHEV